MSAAIIARTLSCAERYATTGASRPFRWRRAGCQYGLGRLRTSNTKSASPGIPCLYPKDSNISARRPSVRRSMRSRISSRSAWTPMAEVSITRSAAATIGSRSLRSDAMASRRLTSARDQRVLAPGLGVALQQHLVARVQEQHLAARCRCGAAPPPAPGWSRSRSAGCARPGPPRCADTPHPCRGWCGR